VGIVGRQRYKMEFNNCGCDYCMVSQKKPMKNLGGSCKYDEVKTL
jgi:hypothetical protein